MGGSTCHYWSDDKYSAVRIFMFTRGSSMSPAWPWKRPSHDSFLVKKKEYLKWKIKVDKRSVHGGLVISVAPLFNCTKKNNKNYGGLRWPLSLFQGLFLRSQPTVLITLFFKGETSCTVNHSVACRLIEIHRRLDPEAHLPAAISTMLLNTINSSATSP